MFTTTTPPRRPTRRERANLRRIWYTIKLDTPSTPETSPDGLTAKQRRLQRNGFHW